MSWMETNNTTLFNCHTAHTGETVTIRQVIMTMFAVPHPGPDGEPINDITTINKLRKIDTSLPQEKRKLKSKLQCWSPSAVIQTRETGNVQYQQNNIMQIDIDSGTLEMYDLEEVKACIFSIPFIAFCGLSCSGTGIYALALISEPQKLSDYATQCLEVFSKYNLEPDPTKGKNPTDLRYTSYDCRMLIKDDPQPLTIKNFYSKSAPKKDVSRLRVERNYTSNGNLVSSSLHKIENARTGSRWLTVQQVAYTLGGLGQPDLINKIKNSISNNMEFAGEETKYHRCAEDCFNDGMQNPLKRTS